MSQIGVTELNLMHVTKHNTCAFCNAELKRCVTCGNFFHAARKNNVYCRDRCRTRKFRADKKLIIEATKIK